MSASQKCGRIRPLCVALPPFHKELENLLNPSDFLLVLKPFPIATLDHTIFIQLNYSHHPMNHMPAFLPQMVSGSIRYSTEKSASILFKRVLYNNHTPSYYYYLLLYQLLLSLQVPLEMYSRCSFLTMIGPYCRVSWKRVS